MSACTLTAMVEAKWKGIEKAIINVRSKLFLIPGTWMNFEVDHLGSKKASYGDCHDEGWKKDPLHAEKKKLERMNDGSQ